MESDKFNLEFLMRSLEDAHNHFSSQKDLKLEPMEYVLIQLTKLFKQINSFLGIAFQDVHEKVGIIRRNKSEFPGENTLYSFVKKQMQLNIHNCNGNNNKKQPCPDKYKKQYISTARSFLRMLWFMTFLNIIFQKALEEKRQKLSAILDHAYDVAFSKNHGWIVRNGAKLAIKVTPGQEVLIKSFIGKYDIEEFKKVGGKFQKMLGPIVTEVWAFYSSNGIDKLQ